jgi:3-oxoacyl-[acyl-carrier-protein] synthase II
MNGVVVTGLGVISAAGPRFTDLSEALRTNRSAASDYDTPLPLTQAAAVLHPVEPVAGFADDRKAWLAMAALDEALADSGDLGDGVISVFLGTGLSSVTPQELEEDAYTHINEAGDDFDRDSMLKDLAADRAAPGRHDPARVTTAVAQRVGANGPCGTSFSACAAAAQAIAEGFRTIRRGEADVAVVGGHDSMLHPFGLLSFVVLGALSPGAGRPFDKHRDGFLIGEGAAILILESESHARARGARTRARLLGAGTSVDGHAATAPQPEGLGAEAAMRAALKDAGLTANDVDYVNAHATATPVGDIAEAAAIHRVVPHACVSSFKGAVGHTIAAAGAIEAAGCIAALEGGFMPGTAGLQELDPSIRINVLRETVHRAPRVVVSNSFGFGGQNAALVFGCAEVSRG